MIREAKSLVGAKVLEFDSGDLLALLDLPIVNPDTGVLEAFWVRPMNLPVSHAVVQVADILEFKKNIYIRSENVMADPADVIRLNEILSEGRDFLNARVMNESGKYYGKLVDLSFDTETYMLKQIDVRKTFLFFAYDRRIFAWGRILRVLPEKIIIDDRTEQKEAIITDATEPAAG